MNSTHEVNQLINRACAPYPDMDCIRTLHGMKATAQRLAEYNHGYRHIKRLLAAAPACPSVVEYAIENSALHSDDWKVGARAAFMPATTAYQLTSGGHVVKCTNITIPGNTIALTY